MITQLSNNKSSGTLQNGLCDAGTPVSGRDAAGRYNILQVNSNGSITNAQPITAAPYIGYSQGTIAVPGGSPPANTYVGTSAVTLNPFFEGNYNINPAFIFPGTVGGGISFVLYRQFSSLYTYINTLPPFNAFNPSSVDLADGLFGIWHNTNVVALGTNIMTSYNRNNTQNVYLLSGTYYLAVITDAGVNFTPGVGQVGVYEFTKTA